MGSGEHPENCQETQGFLGVGLTLSLGLFPWRPKDAMHGFPGTAPIKSVGLYAWIAGTVPAMF
jgi:hypothetical protein